MVDTQGLILNCFVTAANLNDREGLLGILSNFKERPLRLKKIWLDAGYEGEELQSYVMRVFGINLEIVKRTQHQFKVQSKRWIVERTIAWINRYRRLSKDYEYRTSSSESMIYLAGIKNMLRRTAHYK